MRHVLCILAITLSAFAPTARADPQADADYIVGQSVTPEMFEGVIAAQRPIIVGALQNQMRAFGLSLPDPERFLDLFVEEFAAEFALSMHDQTVTLYLETFTAGQLADIAAFYRSEAGQTLLAVTPDLMMAGAQMGQRAGVQAGTRTGKRLAERLKSENLIEVEDPELLYRFLGEPL